MKIWMNVMRDLESLMADHRRLFDAWEEGGVDGLVVGPLVFDAVQYRPGVQPLPGKRPPRATFDPNPRIYRRLGVEPPTPPEPEREKRAALDAALTDAKLRGWSIWVYQASAGAGPEASRDYFPYERSRDALCARMIDTLEHYPMIDGTVESLEWGYEIAPHHTVQGSRRSYIFDDLPDTAAPLCAGLGYDYHQLAAARDRLFAALHDLSEHAMDPTSPGQVTQSLTAGPALDFLALRSDDAGLESWLQFRVEAVTDFFQQARQMLDAFANRPLGLGIAPRSPTFGPLSGYDLGLLGGSADILLPKLYYWHRGFDGMVGTLCRYVETLCAWNPGLSDADALDLVSAWFHLALPWVQRRSDFEDILATEFLEQVVATDTRRCLAVIDDADRVVPWADAGRAPHDGDPMPASQLRRLLAAAGEAGLQRFVYHHAGNLTAGEWAVMSEMCGRAWQPLTSDYRPPDQRIL